ncbi:MAG: choloylglycine hydrolase family protein [Lachnospiraceae bacterium]|nr:choloylglycine hydrolase family protein [Lachnospiraceae bacterium]
MCTAATYKTKDFYFGRTLDYDFSYGEEIAITPRNYCFTFRNMGRMRQHYAMVGIAHIEGDYPLYYDAINEKGLGMAGLNFVGNAKYKKIMQRKDNIATFEFIPWILGQCATVQEAKVLLNRINLTNIPFNSQLPVAQLHWIIADKEGAITVESVESGLKVYHNPVGILTNNPPFDYQMCQLNNYKALSVKEPENQFSAKLDLPGYGRGMGTIGLPGGLDSESRFVRAAFVKMNSISGDSELESISQFFHILGSVDQQRGCCEISDGKYEITIYTSCCNADKGIYYYITYGNRQITAVDMHREDLDGNELKRFALIKEEKIQWQN